jgi:general secretion pathway protein D
MSARLDALRRQGRLGAARHIRLTALDGQKAALRLGEERSVVTGRGVGGRGNVMSTVERRSVGTMVEVLPRVMADGQVKLELHVEDTRMAAQPAGAAEGTPELPSIVSLMATVAVPSGRAVLAMGAGDEVKAGLPHTVIVVVARITEADSR